LSYIRDEGKAGRIGVELMAIVAERPRARAYLPPDAEQVRCAESAEPPSDAPATEIPFNPRYLTTPNYGMTTHGSLFTGRQLLAMCTLSDLVPETRNQVVADGGDVEYADAVATYLALALDRVAMSVNKMVRWNPVGEKLQHAFGRQALSMTWDFADPNVFAGSTGSVSAAIELAADSLFGLGHKPSGHVSQRDVSSASEKAVVCTDPPYYDNVGYADLSDFFYVWLRRSLKSIYPDIFSTLLVPKTQELVADPYRHAGDRDAAEAHFERGLGNAFTVLKATHDGRFPLSLFYAFKQSESNESDVASTGWETMLEGLLKAEFSIHGTWPVRTEMATRMRGQASNALASSIVLVCRPRASDAALATRKDFLVELRSALPPALRHLQQGNIAPVDLAQSAIGPGMGVFSRYVKVVEADGSAMTVRTALELINQVLDETLAEQEADLDAETRWAVSWFEQYGIAAGPFGVAETLSKAKNTALSGLVAAGILESAAGKVRLLDCIELPDSWDPIADARLTVWEVAQHLIRALDAGGEESAAELLRRVGGLGETARDLAYRLYTVCERRKWAKEALAYNGLVVAWPEISRLAAAGPPPTSPAQEALL